METGPPEAAEGIRFGGEGWGAGKALAFSGSGRHACGAAGPGRQSHGGQEATPERGGGGCA